MQAITVHLFFFRWISVYMYFLRSTLKVLVDIFPARLITIAKINQNADLTIQLT
jgi:hypothetical protein